ncbi:ferrous iron transport protein B [Methanolobus halotolerans]|uniref:Ferrous iron transport protein B n=1 Tax=Methanolobus halotolerans TaxID=2052935 RepID=A0A4E0QCU8_9EURY|nr:ferrous iron transport protein B [Methanolobus halotolerans]TGC11077.1 ferrous iron transport protein B [Methanolobus halotolerans]
MAEKIIVALAGNPNVGKTSIFNAITGSKQHVGNWPGVTVEKKMGKRVHSDVEMEVVDLPGTYSLTAYSLDEIVARDFIIEEKPDIVVQVVDGTNLERNLYLTTQLMELGVKLVIALNMSDLVLSKGVHIDEAKMQEYLEVPVVSTIGSTGNGIHGLLDTIIERSSDKRVYGNTFDYEEDIEVRAEELEMILEKDPYFAHYPSRWFSLKLLEGDENILRKARGSESYPKIKNVLDNLDPDSFESRIADQRYGTIQFMLRQVCDINTSHLSGSDMVDRVVTNKYLGIPIFLSLMWAAFEVTFTFATPFMNMIDIFFAWLGEVTVSLISTDWLSSLIGEGIIAGVGSVLIFLPNILLLFFMLSIMEDSGYISRAAFIMDRVMSRIGLHGKSFIPLIMGFGCNVPAIMATRTIEDSRDRLITILVTPFISCGARLPVYVLLAGAFFGRDAGVVIFSLYALGILVALLSAKLMRGTVLRGEDAPFIMELPEYRIPTLRSGIIHMWERGKIYLKKAGGIILLGVVGVWLLASIPVPGSGGQFASGDIYGTTSSLLGAIGMLIEPLVAPLGFDWRIAVALLFGVVAKEIVVGSMGVLYGAGTNEENLAGILAAGAMSPLVGLGLMVFVLLYVPCFACIGVIKRETGSWKWTLFQLFYGTGLAWGLAFLVYQTGSRIGLLS